MQIIKRLCVVLAGGLFCLSSASAVWAQGVVGEPRPWEMGLQRSFSPIQDGIIDLHDLVLAIITVITLFVAGLLAWVVIRYNSQRNPTPSQTSHNTVLE